MSFRGPCSPVSSITRTYPHDVYKRTKAGKGGAIGCFPAPSVAIPPLRPRRAAREKRREKRGASRPLSPVPGSQPPVLTALSSPP